MSEHTQLPTINVPDIWSNDHSECIKVIISGIGSLDLPNDVLKQCLEDNNIVHGDKISVNIVVLETKRKRFVYADHLKYYHRQHIEINFRDKKLSLLLSNPGIVKNYSDPQFENIL